MFYHSLVSDWNNGNAHFLRGVVSELKKRGVYVQVFEPRNNWSLQNLMREPRKEVLAGFRRAYPTLQSQFYDEQDFDLTEMLHETDLVIVHEWNEPELVAKIGAYRAAHPSLRALFHDTHHRAVTDESAMSAYDLRHYDGVLAFGNVLRDLYLRRGWTKQAWTWHEAADTNIFRPVRAPMMAGDLIWVGNWGDDERTKELREFLIEPVRRLGLKARVYGVRYPDEAKQMLADAGIEYGGWLPNYAVPEAFSRFRITIHVPRGPYASSLPGIPTIRVFEALACGLPLISAPWEDSEQLFTAGQDFQFARDGDEMTHLLQTLLADETRQRTQATHGLETIRARHTCAHRADELLQMWAEIRS